MNTLGITILLLVITMVLAGSSRAALVAAMAGVLYLTQEQKVSIAGVNFFAIRFVELAGFVRVLVRREFSVRQLNVLDRLFLLLYGYTTAVFLIRSEVDHAYVIGEAVDASLCYFMFRGLIHDIADVKWFLYALVILLFPYVVLVMLEKATGELPFSVLGAENVRWLRNGSPRCIGSFRNPTLLGTFGASFLPLYFGLYLGDTRKRPAVVGCGLCLLIVWASNAGGAAACVGVALLGWCLWGLRGRMQLARWALVLGIIVLAAVMSAPVYYILAKVSAFSGGDGWHRSRLLELAAQNVDRWWLAGMPLTETINWFPYVVRGTGAADMTNYYLYFGITSGVGALALFCVMLGYAFSRVGIARIVAQQERTLGKPTEYLLWSLGVMLSVHVFNWFGITYFDQTKVYWYLQLAVISSLCAVRSKGSVVTQPLQHGVTEVGLGLARTL